MRHHGKAVLIALAAGLLAVLACAGAALASSWGEVRMAEKEVRVRLKPDSAAYLVRVLKPGDRILVDFPQNGGWVAVFDLDEPKRDISRAVGYVEASQLVPVPQEAPSGKAGGKSALAPEVKGEVKGEQGRQQAKNAAPTAQDPVRITADKMTYSQHENAVVFQGNVHGTQADMAIWATKLTAYFSEKSKKSAGQDKGPGEMNEKIERIVAEGDVRLVSGKNQGACGQLTYMVAEGVLRMEGNPILREGQNTVRGDVIKYYLKENRSEVLSGAQRRVEAVFFSPKGDK